MRHAGALQVVVLVHVLTAQLLHLDARARCRAGSQGRLGDRAALLVDGLQGGTAMRRPAVRHLIQDIAGVPGSMCTALRWEDTVQQGAMHEAL